ncbi:SDR family NAD(P)-dependent oxidoreductase [Chryseobacterium sp. JJR-5R]|uniref:SDR family NAD(P)-dependent oxidoreductase n=1 Tax=Chryseobacterium sp. JJR-5R TaxID=3093923 RepID=UPI002A75B7D4|nr:SDR family NAD(P)-dependent oxidoreductase [Chryseobacterium sp. JJR-5R]WPO84177.1 SDR family NAD(P)-dependent oxidoreductase [Chryseobacterium sp. JJR-5R]
MYHQIFKIKNRISQTLKGKVVIVTGASKGIGAGIAREVATAGVKVVVNYSSSREGADQVVNDITSQGGQAVAIQGDVSKNEDVKKLFKSAEEVYGTAHVVINNAGVYEFAPLELITEESYRRMFDINMLGILLTSQEAVRVFRSH